MIAKTTLALTALLAVSACAAEQRHETPVQSNLQNGGGSSRGSMAYPTPAPQGNLVTTPTR